MKSLHSVSRLSLVMFTFLLLAMLLNLTEAKRRTEKKPKAAVCRYNRVGQEGPCNSTTSLKVITLQLKKASPSTCHPNKIITKPCQDNNIPKKRKFKGCRYERKGSDWSECDAATNQMTKVMNLKEGSSSKCPLTNNKTKSCGSNNKRVANRFRKGCVYNKQPWSECNMDMKSRQREMILVQGDPLVCLPKKIVTKMCKTGCRYTKGEWSQCNPVTNLVQRLLTPKRGESVQCVQAFESRPCQRMTAELVAAKANKCRYTLSEWSTCDLRSNTMTQWMTLKSGDPNVCQRSKKLTKKCRIACKFRRGEWSECDETTHLTTRVDTLVKGSPRECDLTREITKKCKRVCKYTIGEWGPCDPVTNHRTRVKKLTAGGDPKKCQAEEIVTKPCTKKDGEERCFFGPWGDFEPCTNGVMTKHRPVLQGGVECERKGVITKACEKSSQ